MEIEPKTISIERAYTGRLLNVDRERIVNPAGQQIELEMVRHPGASAVVPLLSDPSSTDPQILLLRQFRHAAGGMIWEIPAGVLEPDEKPEQCARRELLEETGVTAGVLKRLTTIFTTPGFTNERIHLYLATDLSQSEPNHQADEFIETQVMRLATALEMIRDGAIVDSKTVIGLLFVAGFILEQ